MEATRQVYKLKSKEPERLSRFFMKGISEMLVFGKKPKYKKFKNYSDALNNDISFLQEDLMEALIKLIKKLPKDEKIKLKNKILSTEVDEAWDDIGLGESFQLAESEHE
jgi:hypothetical protein